MSNIVIIKNGKKSCSRCKKLRFLFNFNKDNNQSSGYRPECRKCEKDYYELTKEKDNQQCREYKKLHKLEISNYNKTYAEEHKEEIKARRKLNKDYINKRQSEYIKNRYSNDINYRILHNLRIRISLALRGKTKASKTKILLGCTIEFLKQHLQSKFKEDMSWNNYGRQGWVVDHILPCISFDMADPEQQKACFHYTNLQPLWDHENCVKQGTY